LTVSVLIADDQAVVRAGLRRILEVDPALQVVGEVEDGLSAVDAAARLRPDLILMDIRMPRLDGLEATRRIVGEDEAPRVLILTTFGLDEYVYEALCAGASGFLLKDAPAEDLLDAVRVIARGNALIDPAVTRSVIARFAALPKLSDELGKSLVDLTPREREVLELLARGRSNAEIATELVVGEGTAKTHVARVLMKLGLRDRVQAVIFAYEAGIVAPGDNR
jgi:DNA-binding NarL/FixJ family response regulator